MRRPLIYLGIVLAASVIVFLIERPDLGPRDDVTGEPVYPLYDARNVERMEVTQLLSGVQLRKTVDGWEVADLITPMRKSLIEKEGGKPPEPKWFKADRTVVGGALGVFGQFPRGVVVSNNPEMQGVYHVTDNVGLRVRLYDGEGGKLVDMVIGKQSPDLNSNYVRATESDEVMLSDRVIDDMYPTAVPRWRDVTIWRVNSETVKAVSVWRSTGSYEVIRADDVWELVEPKKLSLNEEKVKGMVGHLSFLRAVGFASGDDPKINFKRPSLKIKMQTSEGDVVALDVGGSNNLGQFYARRVGDQQVYLVADLNKVIPQNWNDLVN